MGSRNKDNYVDIYVDVYIMFMMFDHPAFLKENFDLSTFVKENSGHFIFKGKSRLFCILKGIF